MAKAVIPMDSCFGKTIIASYTTSNLDGSTLSLSIPTNLEDSDLIIFPGDPLLFSYDIDYNLSSTVLSTTRTSLYISVGDYGSPTSSVFNKLLLRIVNLPKILYTGANTSINFNIYFFYGHDNRILLRTIQITKGKITDINDGENIFLIGIDDVGNISTVSLEESYRAIIPKNWICPQLVISKVIESDIISNTNFDIFVPRDYTFPNYIAGDILYKLVTPTGGLSTTITTNTPSTILTLHFDDEEAGISNREIANYFRFIKITLRGFPAFLQSANNQPLFYLDLKLDGETTYVRLASKRPSNVKQDFNGIYYVDLKNMSIINEEMFNKAITE